MCLSTGLSKEAGTWLATYGARNGLSKGVVGVGIDTSSVDVGSSTNYEAHTAMYSRNLYGIENVANLDQVSAPCTTHKHTSCRNAIHLTAVCVPKTSCVFVTM